MMAVTVGGLFAASVYLILRRNAVHLVIGMVLLGHAANLLILTAGGLTRARPPLVATVEPKTLEPLPAQRANPLTQAMILTAIVIGLAAQAFVLALVYRGLQETGSEDLAAMRFGEQPGAVKQHDPE